MLSEGLFDLRGGRFLSSWDIQTDLMPSALYVDREVAYSGERMRCFLPRESVERVAVGLVDGKRLLGSNYKGPALTYQAVQAIAKREPRSLSEYKELIAQQRRILETLYCPDGSNPSKRQITRSYAIAWLLIREGNEALNIFMRNRYF